MASCFPFVCDEMLRSKIFHLVAVGRSPRTGWVPRRITWQLVRLPISGLVDGRLNFCTYYCGCRHHVGSLVQNVRYYDSTLLCPFSGCQHHIDTLLQGARHFWQHWLLSPFEERALSLHVAAYQCLLTLAVLDTAPSWTWREHASQCLKGRRHFASWCFHALISAGQKWFSRIVLRELTAGFSNCSRPRCRPAPCG